MRGYHGEIEWMNGDAVEPRGQKAMSIASCRVHGPGPEFRFR